MGLTSSNGLWILENLGTPPLTVLRLGHAVGQLVDAQRYKPEGRGLRFPMESLGFYINIILQHCGPGNDLASKRSECQEYFLNGKGGRCVGLTTLLPSCADCLEIRVPQPAGTLRACTGP